MALARSRASPGPPRLASRQRKGVVLCPSPIASRTLAGTIGHYPMHWLLADAGRPGEAELAGQCSRATTANGPPPPLPKSVPAFQPGAPECLAVLIFLSSSRQPSALSCTSPVFIGIVRRARRLECLAVELRRCGTPAQLPNVALEPFKKPTTLRSHWPVQCQRLICAPVCLGAIGPFSRSSCWSCFAKHWGPVLFALPRIWGQDASRRHLGRRPAQPGKRKASWGGARTCSYPSRHPPLQSPCR